ncbi:alpha/beta hydrolase [Rhodococcus sp. NPDC058639]|uniref:alpha/beta hydrolase n=1 Tax=Rhodococcus sp. NPDC058639 TaxID=3346570 RepID=UPI003650CE65
MPRTVPLTIDLSTVTVAVVLPGTGSDANFVDRVFRDPLRSRGIDVVAVDPDPRGVVRSYVSAMDAAARSGPILVGGVSIGAAVAVQWAAEHPHLAAGVLAALPAWTGDPAAAPAAASARWTASELRAHGLDAVTAAMAASSPSWLATELTRSWKAQWPDLPSALEEAAGVHALDVDGLRALEVPVGIAAAVDDAVHPFETAAQWSREIPHAALASLRLADIGADPGRLGTLCLTALDQACAGPAPREDRTGGTG